MGYYLCMEESENYYGLRVRHCLFICGFFSISGSWLITDCTILTGDEWRVNSDPKQEIELIIC